MHIVSAGGDAHIKALGALFEQGAPLTRALMLELIQYKLGRWCQVDLGTDGSIGIIPLVFMRGEKGIWENSGVEDAMERAHIYGLVIDPGTHFHHLYGDPISDMPPQSSCPHPPWWAPAVCRPAAWTPLVLQISCPLWLRPVLDFG